MDISQTLLSQNNAKSLKLLMQYLLDNDSDLSYSIAPYMRALYSGEQKYQGSRLVTKRCLSRSHAL